MRPVIEATGLNLFGASEWQREKHGGSEHRTGRKLNLAIDPNAGEILAFDGGPSTDLQGQVLDLRVLRDVLRHVADCPAPSHLECPTFRKILKAATRRRVTHQVDRSRRRALP